MKSRLLIMSHKAKKKQAVRDNKWFTCANLIK